MLIWTLMLGAIALGNILEGGHLMAFVQPSAAVIVFLPLAIFLFGTLGFRDTFTFASHVFRGKIRGRDEKMLERLSTMGFMTGGASAVIGMIHVMSNLSDSSRLGAGIAVAFVGVFYGMIPALLCTAVCEREAKPAEARRRAGSYAAAAVLLLLFSFFVVLYSLSGTEKRLAITSSSSTWSSPR